MRPLLFQSYPFFQYSRIKKPAPKPVQVFYQNRFEGITAVPEYQAIGQPEPKTQHR